MRSYDTECLEGQRDRQRYGQVDSQYQADLGKHLARLRKLGRRLGVGRI